MPFYAKQANFRLRGAPTPLYSVYTLQTVVPPKLNFAIAGTKFALSWTIPSTNFTLQQSSDLKSWINVTNVPVLNLTNLQDQVFLTLTNANRFFRMK
jgi:hypothetical protein